jgi:hypothetical protein
MIIIVYRSMPLCGVVFYRRFGGTYWLLRAFQRGFVLSTGYLVSDICILIWNLAIPKLNVLVQNTVTGNEIGLEVNGEKT